MILILFGGKFASPLINFLINPPGEESSTYCTTSAEAALKYFRNECLHISDYCYRPNSNFSNLNFRKKIAKLLYLANSFVEQDYLMHSIMVIILGWNLCSISNFMTVFPLLPHFAAFLDHEKESSSMTKNDEYF